MHNNSQIDQIKLRQETVKKYRTIQVHEQRCQRVYICITNGASIVHYGNKSLWTLANTLLWLSKVLILIWLLKVLEPLSFKTDREGFLHFQIGIVGQFITEYSACYSHFFGASGWDMTSDLWALFGLHLFFFFFFPFLNPSCIMFLQWQLSPTLCSSLS